MIKRLSFALRLSDVCLGRPLLRSEASVYVDGAPVLCEYKTGGYFAVTDLDEGVHHVEVKSFKLQSAELDIKVDYSIHTTARQCTYYLMLNPSEAHPEAVRLPAVTGRVKNADFVYILSERGELKVAEDMAQSGSTRLKLFCGGARPSFPSTFRIMDRNSADSEVITISGFDGDEYILAGPLQYRYARSASVVPLIQVSCNEEGEFFFLIPPDFKADADSGEIALRIFSLGKRTISSTNVKAQPTGTTRLGELKMIKGG